MQPNPDESSSQSCGSLFLAHPEPLGGPESVHVYVDESKPDPSYHQHRQSWLYLGVLAIPTRRLRDAADLLEADRLAVGYTGELHFSRISQSHKEDLANRWLDHVLYGENRMFYFAVLGIHLNNLCSSAFGDSRRSQVRRIYERFFRTAVGGALQGFFPQEVVIDGLFHDKGDMEHDELFDWHSAWRLGRDYPGVSVRLDRLSFIDSDHRQAKTSERSHSHFIQLADLVLGAVRQCMDATSVKDPKVRLGKRALPLVRRMTDPAHRSNPNSRYDHFRRFNIAFFPSRALSPEALADPFQRVRSLIYTSRTPLLPEQIGQQAFPFEI